MEEQHVDLIRNNIIEEQRISKELGTDEIWDKIVK